MDLRRWLDADWRHRTFLILAALLGTFAGVDLLLNRPEGSWLQWLGVPLLAGGGSLLAVCAWPTSLLSQKNRTYLANRFIRTITWHGRLVPYFPVIGISILFADLGYNAILSDRKSTRLNSSHQIISYAVFCLKKKIKIISSQILTTI